MAEFVKPLMYLVHAKGANRVSYTSAEKISEAFDKDSTPTPGSICALLREGDDESSEGEFLIGLAVTRGVAGIASGALRATLAPIFRLRTPLAIEELQTHGVSLGKMPMHFYARQLDSATVDALITYIAEADESVIPWLNAVLGIPRLFNEGVQQSRVEGRDAVMLAAQIAEMPLPADAFNSSAVPQEKETLLDTVLNAGYERDMEEELLPLDLQRFDGKMIADQRAASLTVFEDRNGLRKLLVMSVNKKPIEEELGVDLLYWDQVHDAFTFVQYKRLEKTVAHDATGQYEWAYRRKGEIEKQLALMPSGREAPISASDWRAFDTPFWFKFVRGDAARKLDEQALKGMYVSADWLRMAVTDSTFNVGPKGGFRVTYDNTKYLGRASFTQLVSRGFIGTGSTRSNSFKTAMDELGTDRELIIAIRTDWQKDDHEVLDGALSDSRLAAHSELPF